MGALEASQLIDCYCIQDDFSWDGCEMQHRKYSNSMTALLNVELELQVEKDNVEIGDHRV